MSVSIIVCAYTLDRWDALCAAVDSCGEQTLRPDEVVLVIDHNDELLERATREIVGARVIANQSTKGLSGARNTGVAATSGDIVVFLDDDAYGETEWLQSLVTPMNESLVAGSGGWIVPHWEGATPAWFPETFLWILGCSYEGLPPDGSVIRNPIGASMAIRRSVFDAVGGFTSGIGRIGLTPLGCEETELCIRYTQARPLERFVLSRGSVVHHRVPASRLTWHYFWTRCWAEGLSKAAVASLVGSNSGLAAERRHVMKALPRDIVSTLRLARRNPKAAATKAILVVAGVTLAAAGYARGRYALKRSPLERSADDHLAQLQATISATPPPTGPETV
jgi:glycosyltransferase involved in cell wall biosynthesis